ncbi:MAG: glyoxalase [Bacteroidetes bacterium RIFCSPHIGHO2_02_FULL_44_7]|nr:MAG: glyoxalase [Bacteroidetes bacterium RIFCSPHIGHO2_02_FULL_44_7]
MAKVIGLGGVFIKFKDPKAMRLWYEEALGMKTNAYGVLFEFNRPDAKRGFLQLGTFEAESTYFGAATQQVMLNFRVDDLTSFEKELRDKGIRIVDTLESYDFGKFLHIEDPEGNRIELWEPAKDEASDETSMPLA